MIRVLQVIYINRMPGIIIGVPQQLLMEEVYERISTGFLTILFFFDHNRIDLDGVHDQVHDLRQTKFICT